VTREGVEEGLIKGIALGVVLDAKAERIIAQARLLDHLIVHATRFNDQTGTETIERLMMGTVDVSQGLDILKLELVVIGDVEMERAAQRNIEHLDSSTDGEDGKAQLKDLGQQIKFPSVSRRIGTFDQMRIGHGLTQEFQRDVLASGKKQTVDAFRDGLGTRVPQAQVWIGAENPGEGWLVALANPCGDIFQPETVTSKAESRFYYYGGG
jgi:hypothetical protein